MTFTNKTRRQFLRHVFIGSGVLALSGRPSRNVFAEDTSEGMAQQRLPGEVWIATLSQHEIHTETSAQMVDRMLEEMQKVVQYQPDIVCLPELFPNANIDSRLSVSDLAERPPGPITGKFAGFARKHQCYVICPTYTKEDGNIYNAAVVIDRTGGILGEYRKIHPTESEIAKGVMPGRLDPPVFQTDFGTIGIQICFDIQWDDGWNSLEAHGAEIVFWPSAFAGGDMVNIRAWKQGYCMVSSTNKDTSKICNVAGQQIAGTGRWNPHHICAPVNLETAFLHTWPYVKRFPEIEAKYGRKVNITNFHEEEWSIIESRPPDVKVADILKEFDLKTMHEHLRSAEQAQNQVRPV
ncbi:MAG TPA: carbon-nitrogen hydrolase family protein [bacterium]|nr:carbon-nitrogen hydrolase family protein [bacterium]